MKPAVIFTNKISVDLMNWLKKHSVSTKKTKRAIIEEALSNYRDEVIRSHMVEDFKRAAKDPEIVGMAEEGMSVYLEQLKRFDV